jgi:hypothetical protein
MTQSASVSSESSMRLKGRHDSNWPAESARTAKTVGFGHTKKNSANAKFYFAPKMPIF